MRQIQQVEGSTVGCSSLCPAVLLARRLPDLSRCVGVHGGDGKTDDQVRPGGKSIGCKKACGDDRHIGERVIAR